MVRVAVENGIAVEDALVMATHNAALQHRLHRLGAIAPGYQADLLLFDPARVRARSTYVDPLAMAEGFDLVMVNGRVAFAEGRKVGAAGALLRARDAAG